MPEKACVMMLKVGYCPPRIATVAPAHEPSFRGQRQRMPTSRFVLSNEAITVMKAVRDVSSGAGETPPVTRKRAIVID